MKQNNSNIENFIKEKLSYIQNIITDTIYSINYNSYLDANLFSENDKNLSITILTDLHQKTNDIYEKIKNNNNSKYDDYLNDLQKIIDKLSMIICGFGTKNISDLLFVSFGSEFKNMKYNNSIIDDKFDIIKKFIIPFGYKINSWKNKNTHAEFDNIYCCDKMNDDIIIPENMNNIECIMNNDITDDNIHLQLHSIKVIFHNKKLKKTMVIHGFIPDFPILCLINNNYIKERLSELNDIHSNNDNNTICVQNLISSLSLHDLLIYSKNDITKKHFIILKDIEYVKNNHIDNVVKKFLDMNTKAKRSFLINLLLCEDDKDVQYICYVLYDIINTNNGNSEGDSEGSIIYDTFPSFVKLKFKNIIKLNIKNLQDINQKLENNKLNLEQQIRMLKIDNLTREKAINKLNDMKGKPDEMTLKTKQYLEGLIKIPFGMYCEEPVIKKVKENNTNFYELLANYNSFFNELNLPRKQKYTNFEIYKYTNQIHKSINLNLKDIIIKNTSNISLKILNSIYCELISYFKENNITIKSVSSKTKSNLIHFIDTNICNNNLNLKQFISVYNKIALYQGKNKINIEEEMITINNNVSIIDNDLINMENILDNSIHGHKNAKKQIMKIIGQWMNGEKEGYSFGFEGSPGIGKTSLANKGITQCLKDENNNSRPFNFIALGGSSNGSFLEGHGYTYMNSTWGKIIDILMDSKCMNPIIYIDELDKVSKTEQGREIIGILTHLIDPTQNTSFQDKYFTGINIDVSKILFIFSYNDPEQIDKILLDRIHRIKFENLSIKEKIIIVKKFILPEINKKMGFENIIELNDECIQYIIESYTLEPGVRKLKEILFDLYGEINIELLKYKNNLENTPIIMTIELLETTYMSKYTKIKDNKIHDKPKVGIINGLWANSMGCGGIIQIQSLLYPTSSFLELQLTGLQGDVMKESMNVAKNLAWSLTDDNIKSEWLEYFKETKCQGLHIHCPEGGISKDGPSAGAAITTAIYSLLNKKLIRNNIAITGEITLNGDVTAIGGLESKLTYGIKAGVKKFLFPKDNTRDFSIWFDKNDIPSDINFIEISSIHEIFEHVFCN
jgi:ATP-dependent Lon protease